MAEGIDIILDVLRDGRGIDFAPYKRSMVERRMALRLNASGRSDYASYARYLTDNPQELTALINALLINVSFFFRNPLVFDVLEELILPVLIRDKGQENLRIWSAGCANGEEPYSVAMITRDLAETAPRAFILGTDIDRDALKLAGRASYGADAVLEVRKGCLDRHFMFRDGLYLLGDRIKSMVLFAYHDVTTNKMPKEGVFSDYDLVLCRNVLIYFERNLHEKVLRLLAKSIRKGGFLVLGEAESLCGDYLDRFYEFMPGTNIFKKL